MVGIMMLALAGALSSCSNTAPTACKPGGDGTYVDQTYDDLARYCVVEMRDGDVAPLASRVLPYEVSTPLFSDYATKRRTVWVPQGSKATYSDTDVFDFPLG